MDWTLLIPAFIIVSCLLTGWLGIRETLENILGKSNESNKNS